MRAALVSVCVPAYNAERHLQATLDSVLASDHDNFEVVVLDNGSTDATADIVRAADDPRIRLEHNETVLPLPDNWNRVVRLSRGPLVKVVCADDLVSPECLRLQAAVLEDEAVALVAGRRHLIDGEGHLLVPDTGLHRLVGRFTARQVLSRVLRNGGNPIGESASVMFRRRDFDTCGGFDPELLFPMDLELWMRLLDHGDFVGLQQTVAAFRASSGSLSAARSDTQYLEQRELARRLAAGSRLPLSDRVLSHVGARLARLRRQLLFWLAEHPQAGDVGRRLTSGDEVDWVSRPGARRPGTRH